MIHQWKKALLDGAAHIFERGGKKTAEVDEERVALWSWTVETDAFVLDERAFDMWGLEPVDQVTSEDSSRIHPADRDRVRTADERGAASGAPVRPS